MLASADLKRCKLRHFMSIYLKFVSTVLHIIHGHVKLWLT